MNRKRKATRMIWLRIVAEARGHFCRAIHPDPFFTNALSCDLPLRANVGRASPFRSAVLPLFRELCISCKYTQTVVDDGARHDLRFVQSRGRSPQSVTHVTSGRRFPGSKWTDLQNSVARKVKWMSTLVVLLWHRLCYRSSRIGSQGVSFLPSRIAWTLETRPGGGSHPLNLASGRNGLSLASCPE